MNMNKLRKMISNYHPYSEQEKKDQALMLQFIDVLGERTLYRDCPGGHFTASGIIFNKDHTKMLMCEHLVDHSLAWLGGHADGMADMLKRATLEITEESGITRFFPISGQIGGLTVIAIPGHVKRGEFVSSHIHLDVAYAFEADENEPIVHQKEENSGVRWVTFEEMRQQVADIWKRQYAYEKFIEQYA